MSAKFQDVVCDFMDAWALFDIDCDGAIDINEFKNTLRVLGLAPGTKEVFTHSECGTVEVILQGIMS